MKKKLEIKTYKIISYCDLCKKGEMKSNGQALLCDPPKYILECTNCKHQEVSEKLYPSIEQEEVWPYEF